MFILRASLPDQPLPNINDTTSVPSKLLLLLVFLAICLSFASFFGFQSERSPYTTRYGGEGITGGGSKRAAPNEYPDSRTTKRAKRQPLDESCGEEGSDGDDCSDGDFSADENEDYQNASDGRVLCPLESKKRKNQRRGKHGINRCPLGCPTFSTLRESFENALEKHPHCRQCRKSLFESGKDIEHLTLNDVSDIFFNEHKYLRDHILRVHLNVFPCRIDDGDQEYCDKGGFGLRVAFRLHKKTHSGYKGKLEKKDWQGYWERAQKALKKERPSKRKVFDSVSKCCDTQRLNHIVATYYDHKEAIDNDRTSQEFDKLSKDLHPFGISDITLNGIATAVHYQEGISPVKSMASLLPVPENTAPLSLSNGSNGYRTSNSGNFYAAPESFYTAPAYPTGHGSIPDLDAPQIPLEEPQGPSTFLPQNQALSHAGGGLDTNLNTPGVLLRCEEAANTMMRILAFSELVDVSQFVDMHDGTCRAIYGILDSIYRPNGQQMPSNGTDTMPHNPQNPQNLRNFGDPAYIAADDVSMVYTTATNGSEQQIQPSNIHTAISMHQHSAILNPLNRQGLQPGRFPNQAGPSSAAEGIQGWAEDANDLHQRLYERGLSRENGYHDHTESGG